MQTGPEVGELIDQSGPYTHGEALYSFATSQLSPLNRRPKLLDLRCGTGHLAEVFAAAKWNVIGVDCSSGFEGSWARIRETHSNCQFIVSEDLPLLSETGARFDLIVAFDDLAIELTQGENLASTLDFSIQSLRQGGLFVCQVERRALWIVNPIEAAIETGFREAWRASVVDPGTPIDGGVAHRGSRELFVARR